MHKGALLDVYRIISRNDPYRKKDRPYHHKVKIGKIKVLHAEARSAIAQEESLLINQDTPYIEIKSFNIGDHVRVSIDIDMR